MCPNEESFDFKGGSFTYVNDINEEEESVKIKVIGIGGGGNNAVKRMSDLNIKCIELFAANTDNQVLRTIKAQKGELIKTVQLGANLTNGKGAGSKPEIGEQAAEESIEQIKEALQGADIVFLAAGMGGGTGTGSTPVFARVARDLGILTVAIVTKPFDHEGKYRINKAEKGIQKLKEIVNCLLVIPNQRIPDFFGKSHTLINSFSSVDNILRDAVRSLADIIIKEGLINMDLKDIETVMEMQGIAIISTAEAEGENRARIVTHKAISSPLLENIQISKAKGVLMNIYCNENIGNGEYEECMAIINETLENGGEDAIVKYGIIIDNDLGDKIRVSILATGIVDDSDNSNYEDNSPKNNFINNNDNEDNFGVPSYLKL